MKLWMMAFLVVSVNAYAGGKAMDCSECRDHYTEDTDTACQPICGPLEFHGKKAAKLLDLMDKDSGADCGMGKCGSTMDHFACHWRNGPSPGPMTCSFLDDQGKQKEMHGTKAERLAKAVDALLSSDSDCGAGQCGYTDSRDVACTAPNGRRVKSKDVTCTLSVTKDAEEAADSQPSN